MLWEKSDPRPRKSHPTICLCQAKEVFGSNRANFLTDRIQDPAKTININKQKDLVKIQQKNNS